MRTKHLSFQLEESYLGAFLFQGWLGGILTGFVWTVVMCYGKAGRFDQAWKIFICLGIIGIGVGVIKSTLMWGVYRFTRFQPRAIVRVVLASIGSALVAYGVGILFDTRTTEDLVALVRIFVLGGLPTAVLIGSSVKPWELFTFGSIAVGDSRTGGRVGSKSVCATLATLPLRFLSLTALAVLILAYASKVDSMASFIGLAIRFFIPFMYFLYSAYVTFKSPHRVPLLVSGIVLNVPVGLITYYAYINGPGSYLFNPALPYVFGIGSAFLIAWALFLVARLTAPTQKMIDETDLQEILGGSGNDLDHHCLGSRFMEWQERHA